MNSITPIEHVISDVLVLGHSSKLSGAELSLLDVVHAFGAGTDIFLFEDGPLRPALVQRGKSVIISKRANSFGNIKKDRSLLRALPHVMGLSSVCLEIAKLARSHRLVYATSQKAFVLGAPAAFLARRPLVWHLRDILSPEHFGGAQAKLAVTLANHFAKRVLVPSNATAKAFVAAGGKQELVRVVPNGLDVPPSDGETRDSLRSALGLPDGFLLGVFSRISPWKGQHIVIEALATLPANARLIIVGAALFGEDAYMEQLRDTETRLGVSDRVVFMGHRNDVPKIMRAVDVVVHSSVDPEPFGRTLVEAMLSRVPVVASANGAAPEILNDGEAGILIPPNDPPAMATALRQLMTTDTSAMVDRAEKRALTMYNATRMIKDVRDELRQV
jgi:glycosyltransferase involved in cell wall biosynthesis